MKVFLFGIAVTVGASLCAAGEPALDRLAETLRPLLVDGYKIVVHEDLRCVTVVTDAEIQLSLFAQDFVPPERWLKEHAGWQATLGEWERLGEQTRGIDPKAPRDERERELLNQKDRFWKTHAVQKLPDCHFGGLSFATATITGESMPSQEKVIEAKAFWAVIAKVVTMYEKAAQPGATDNPGDAQRLREDH